MGVSVSRKDGGVLPDSGLPRVSGMETRNVQRPLSETVQTRASHTTHMHSVHGRRLGVIPSKRPFGAERVRSGSSCSRVVGELVVLATVVEVVVHVS